METKTLTRVARFGCRPLILALAVLAPPLAPVASARQGSFVNWETPQVHPIDLTPSGGVLAAVNTADNRLEVFDVVAGTPVRRGSVFTGLEPVSVRMRGETEAWVVNQLSDSVSLVNLATMRVVRTVPVGDEPADIIFAGSPERAFVSLSQSRQLARFDPTASAPTITTTTIDGPQPRALAKSPDGALVYVAVFESGNRSVIVPRQTVNAITGPYGGQNPPPNSGNNFVPAIASGLPPAPRVAHIVRKNSAGQWIDGNNRNWSSLITWDVLDNDVAVVNASTGSTSYVKGLMTTVAGLGVAPDGRILAIGTEARNELRFESNLNGIFLRCLGATINAGGTGTAAIFDLNPHLAYTAPSTDLATRMQSIGDPRGVAWMPDGTRAFVAGMGANNVVAVSPAGARLGLITVGAGPTGLVISPDGSALYVLNRFEASVSVVSTTTNTETLRVPFFDPTPDEIVAGRPFLYDTQFTSGLGHVSCASCHVDARSDRLAWDLGDPAGAMISFNATCVDNTSCIDWHPMKGPIVTQTLQGIIGQEPFHWRGEKTGLEDFNAAYTNLQGRSAVLTTEEMATLKAYVATLTFGPQPNRNIDGTLRTSLPIFGGVVVGTGGTGNPSAGETVFNSLVTLPNGPGGNSRCVDCHAGLPGTSNEIGIPLGPVAQNRKIAYLRDVYHKTGANLASTTALRGFGFNSDSEFQTLQDLLSVGFTFGTGTTAMTRRRDLEAFMLSFGTDTHAGVGQQELATNGGGAGDNVARINQFITIANSGSVGLVVKGRSAGIDRGWVLDAGVFLSDREAEAALSPATLLAMSASGNEIVYTLVPAGTQRRIGIDRDEDGLLDRDELDSGSNPSDPNSPFSSFCSGDGTQALACPCANNGLAGRGCNNSAATGGAQLTARGSPMADTVVLTSSGELPTVLSIFLQGNALTANPLPFGDGIRCAGGALKRLYVKNASGGAVSAPMSGDNSIRVQSALLGDTINAGTSRWYQVYYRDPDLTFCASPAGSSFNVSNALEIAY